MNFEYYKRQIDRLAETFGASHYKQERITLIWVEVKNYGHDWFRDVINDFIGCSERAPLLPAFREKIAVERERLHKLDKEQHKETAREFISQFTGDDIKIICSEIRRRVKGDMTDQEFKNFGSIFGAQIKCRRCDDTGVYLDDDKTCRGMTACFH